MEAEMIDIQKIEHCRFIRITEKSDAQISFEWKHDWIDDTNVARPAITRVSCPIVKSLVVLTEAKAQTFVQNNVVNSPSPDWLKKQIDSFQKMEASLRDLEASRLKRNLRPYRIEVSPETTDLINQAIRLYKQNNEEVSDFTLLMPTFMSKVTEQFIIYARNSEPSADTSNSE